jgi:hypothetical protein
VGVADIMPPRMPHGYAEVVAYYGDPKPVRLSSGEWRVDDGRERANLVRFDHALLPKAPCRRCGERQPGHVYVHRLFVEPLRFTFDGWAELRRRGSDFQLDHVACYAPRALRGSNGLLPSLHTFAAAFDVNPEDNPLVIGIVREDPRRISGCRIPEAHIAVAKAAGLFHGRDFERRSDPMHLQGPTGY